MFAQYMFPVNKTSSSTNIEETLSSVLAKKPLKKLIFSGKFALSHFTHFAIYIQHAKS